jgi:flagellar assembly protein FliH
VLRVNEAMVEPAEELARKLTAEHGFSGKLIVLGQADIAPGDGRIEWAEGGFVLDSQQLSALVEQAVARVFGHGQAEP